MTYSFLVIDVLSGLTIAAQVLVALFATVILLGVFNMQAGKRFRTFASTHGLVLMFLVALLATSGSLFFSEIALFAPCKDCWFQRILMYPQVLLLGIALWRNDSKIALYILPLCILGISISVFHYYGQMEALLSPKEGNALKPCDLTGISCQATYIFQHGYITIPVMAGTAFALNILGSINMIIEKRRS